MQQSKQPSPVPPEGAQGAPVESADSQEYFRILVQEVRDCAIFGMDPEGRISHWNEGAERIKGYKTEEILGSHLRVLYPTGERESGEPEQHLDVALQTGLYHGEGWRLRKDGSRFWAEVSISSLRNRDNSLRGFAKVTRDTTHRRAGELALARTTRELLRANQDLEQFAYAAAHDLQEPIRNISILTERLAALFPVCSSEVAELFNFIIGGSRRLQALVRDLYAYIQAVGEAEKSPLTDGNEAGREALIELASSIRNTGASVSIEPLPRVPICRPHLVLLLQNLVANALKYRSERSPTVRIWAEREDESWLFSVEDNGIGVPEEYRERIFQLFKRLHGQDVPGTGIGLAICCRLVAHYGGRIWVEPARQGGSIFRFTVSCSEES